MTFLLHEREKDVTQKKKETNQLLVFEKLKAQEQGL